VGPTLKVANDPKRHVLLNKQCFHVKFVQRAAVYLLRKKIPKALLKLDIAKTLNKQCFHLKFVQRAAVYLRRKKIPRHC
jgi:hypothetical protein